MGKLKDTFCLKVMVCVQEEGQGVGAARDHCCLIQTISFTDKWTYKYIFIYNTKVHKLYDQRS